MKSRITRVKEKVKNSKKIVFLYERLFVGVGNIKKEILTDIRVIKTRMKIKTRYSFGNKNSKKTFFVITSDAVASGIYSTIFYILPFLEYADKKKYIPIVDLSKTYLPLIHDNICKELDNAWEYYYQQPISEYTLDEVYQSKNVIMMVDSAIRIKMPKWNDMFPADEEILKKWGMYIEKYIKLIPQVSKRIEESYDSLHFKDKKIMGVGVRAGYRAGMMRNVELFNGHPKVPNCEQIISVIEKKLLDWKCDAIFLSCDDREYCEKIKQHLGDKCLYIDRKLTHYFENDVPVLPSDEKYLIEKTGYSVRELTEEYIVETYLLAKCNSLYSCIGGGAQFAYFVNGGKYEHLEVYNEGMYEGLGN